MKHAIRDVRVGDYDSHGCHRSGVPEVSKILSESTNDNILQIKTRGKLTMKLVILKT